MNEKKFHMMRGKLGESIPTAFVTPVVLFITLYTLNFIYIIFIKNEYSQFKLLTQNSLVT